ncbi:histidinol dehydrogenase [Streptomyces sp. 2A115]|uniref:histidinol dehydrogenase n=1 Tax=Streptomyces sp. 2A115 TaxID=3457439 RepID=UPI003FD53926
MAEPAWENHGQVHVVDSLFDAYRLADLFDSVLPTLGAARYTGGLWVGKFLKTVTYQEVRNLDGSAMLGEARGRLSRLERFEGHARSDDVRAAKYGAAPLSWAPRAVQNQSPSSNLVQTDRITADIEGRDA